LSIDLMPVADVVMVELRRLVMSRLMLATVVIVADRVLANTVSMLRLAETFELAVKVWKKTANPDSILEIGALDNGEWPSIDYPTIDPDMPDWK
jgi:hypothetical protein